MEPERKDDSALDYALANEARALSSLMRRMLRDLAMVGVPAVSLVIYTGDKAFHFSTVRPDATPEMLHAFEHPSAILQRRSAMIDGRGAIGVRAADKPN